MVFLFNLRTFHTAQIKHWHLTWFTSLLDRLFGRSGISPDIPRWLQVGPLQRLQDRLESLEVGNLCLVRIPKIEVFGASWPFQKTLKKGSSQKKQKILPVHCRGGDAGKNNTCCRPTIVHDTYRCNDFACATIWVHAPARPLLHLGDFHVLRQRHLFWNCSKSAWGWRHARPPVVQHASTQEIRLSDNRAPLKSSGASSFSLVKMDISGYTSR